MMRVELYLNFANEMAAFSEFAANMAKLQEANEKLERQRFDNEAGIAVKDDHGTPVTVVETAVGEAKKERKRKITNATIAEAVAATDPVVAAAIATKTDKEKMAEAAAEITKTAEAQVAQATVVAAAAPAAPVFSKQVLEDKVRLLAKTNFAAVKALLATYSVERFGKLDEAHYTTFGPKLLALPEFPEPAVA